MIGGPQPSRSPPSVAASVSAALLPGRDEHWAHQLTPQQLQDMTFAQRQKQGVMQEIVFAERAYVRDLRLIIKVFMDEMKSQGLVTREEAAGLFCNIPTLLDVHTNMLKELEQLKRDQGGLVSDDGLGLIFLKRTKLFKHYAHYCVNYIGMAQRLAALRENPKIAGFFEDCLKNPECRNSSFESFLITPLQRMAKYPLLLASLLKHSDPDHPEYAQLARAYEEIKHVVDTVNNRAQQEENLLKMMDLQNAVTLVHGEEYRFCERGRHIVKEGPVCAVRQGRKKKASKDSYLVLFNDKIALFRLKVKGKRKGYKVMHVWEGDQLICLPLSEPSSRNPTNVPAQSSSPGGQAAASPDCGIRAVEKDREEVEYKLIFSSVGEKADWLDKMKTYNMGLQESAEESKENNKDKDEDVNEETLAWEKKYHMEVAIRTELKRLLDATVQQLSDSREEVNEVTREREALKKEVARLKGKSRRRKKEQREEPTEHISHVIKAAKEQEADEEKGRWLTRSLSSELDEVIRQRFEQQQAKAAGLIATPQDGWTIKTETDQGQAIRPNYPSRAKEIKRSTSTLGRKSVGSAATQLHKTTTTTKDRMPFLDLPSRSSTTRSTDSAGRVDVTRPASAREPRSRTDYRHNAG